MTPDLLRVALLELARELQPHGIRLIVGGGYGLILRAAHVRASGARTLGPSIPVIRGTEDIDCFLQADLMADGSSTKAIRETLDRLSYTPIVEHMQFARTTSQNGVPLTTKIDFLAAPVPDQQRMHVKVSAMRMRPRTFNRLHAYVTPEAFSIEEELLEVDISEDRSAVCVYLPHPFSYLILKLIALRDRLARREAEGKYHALDLYTIWASITEPEWEQALRMRGRFAAHPVMQDARGTLSTLFTERDSPGVVALRDQARRQGVEISEEHLEQFRADLRELLSEPD